MTYLDTHVVVWLASAAMERLSAAAREHIETAELRFSPVVLLELEYLYEIERITIPAKEVRLKLQCELDLKVCDLGFDEVMEMALAEKWTRDPFDRIIVAQAKANGLAHLVSADQAIRTNYARTIW